jgi:hypothetical protein
MNRAAVLLSGAIGVAVFAAGTVATLYLSMDSHGEMPDPYKVGGTWVILGAIIGRVAFNVMTPKPASSNGS